MRIKRISTDKAPEEVGPYSKAIETSDTIFVSGQIPLDPVCGKMIEGGIRKQTARVLENISAILNANGNSMEHIAKVGVFIANIKYSQEMNEGCEQYFSGEIKPARSVAKVPALPKDAMIEIACVAVKL